MPAAAKHDPTWLRGNTIADDDVDVVDDADGEDGGDDADAENAARKHGRWWSCHGMLCYVMIILKISFHNNIFKVECSKGGHCKKWRWTPQNACLGIVAVDTAKTLKMEWEGWDGWESRVWVVAVDTAKRMKMHAINNNQVFITTSLQSFRLKSASYNNQVVIPTCMHSFKASDSTVSRGLNRLQSFSPRSLLLLLLWARLCVT